MMMLIHTERDDKLRCFVASRAPEMLANERRHVVTASCIV